MLPEIARRCESCGAAIRVHAIFCPQCGVPLRREDEKSKSSEIDASESKMKEPDDELKTMRIMPPTATEQLVQTNVVEPATEVVHDAAPQTEISQQKIEEAEP